MNREQLRGILDKMLDEYADKKSVNVYDYTSTILALDQPQDKRDQEKTKQVADNLWKNIFYILGRFKTTKVEREEIEEAINDYVSVVKHLDQPQEIEEIDIGSTKNGLAWTLTTQMLASKINEIINKK